MKQILSLLSVLIIGVSAGYFYARQNPGNTSLISPLGVPLFQTNKKQVIGFLPYWLLSSANSDYSLYFNTLTYFGLTLDADGHILKKTNRTETEPGWHSLNIGKANSFFDTAKSKKMTLSLLVFASKEDDIYALIDTPEQSAQNLITDIVPIMQQYGFTDLNVDIESIATASDSARTKFTTFIRSVNQQLKASGKYTLTVEVTASDAIKNKLINVTELAGIADKVVIMAYDYHYMGSGVTGPIAPLSGGGATYEYDVETAINEALKYLPADKIVLGIPSYGYEWETLSEATSSAVLPGSGLTASTTRILKEKCATCEEKVDPITQEAYMIYKDEITGTYHQVYYPNQQSTQSKVDLAKTMKLGGIAVWALGYEDPTLYEPLSFYKP